MAGPLLVPCEDHFDIFVLIQHVENLEHHPTRKCKDRLHAFALEAFDKDFSACEFHQEPPHLIRWLPTEETPKTFRGFNQSHLPRDHSEVSEKSRGKMRDPTILTPTGQ